MNTQELYIQQSELKPHCIGLDDLGQVHKLNGVHQAVICRPQDIVSGSKEALHEKSSEFYLHGFLIELC